MVLDPLHTNFVDFINYTFSIFAIMLLTAGMFLSYPFLKGEIEDEEKNGKEAQAFTIGFSISIFMTLMCLLVMIVTPIYAMFKGINIVEFIEATFSVASYAKNNVDDTDLFLMLIILLANFSIIAWIGGLITRFWGDKIFLKTDRVDCACK